jgi:RimJ/RimL family protein N-acetyltransferase
MSQPAFETERTVARSWRPDEVDRFFDLYRRWEVSRWLGANPTAMAEAATAAQRIDRWAALNSEQPDEGRWAIARKDDGSVVGTILLVRLPDGDGEVEVGWHLHPDSWGLGFATEAGRGAVEWAFAGGRSEVLAVVRPDNAASLAVCRRISMEHLGRTSKYYDSELELFRSTVRGDPTGDG